CFLFVFLAETNLTGERPFHTRTQEEPGNDTDPAPHHTNWRRLLFCYLVSDTFLDIVTDVLGVDEWGINRLLIS
ncbi:hypothetical protein, partial [Bifidobacterium longum]|uniref:hypothetical protein n=1 Tax=Bifidobacterium longum TaxID=216816 RepID=UPI001C4DED32